MQLSAVTPCARQCVAEKATDRYDTFTGGAGSDLFIIRPGCGVDVITDFQAGAGSEDALLFSSSLFSSFSQVMANAAQVRADTWIGDGLWQYRRARWRPDEHPACQ